MITPPQWTEQTLRRLSNIFEQDRLPHALLVDAVAGWGVEDFVSALVCSIVTMDGDPREIPHPDVLWIKPDPRLLIEQVRDSNEFVYRSVQVSSVKVVVLEAVETATTAASNALLKSLEEPPPTSLLILTTTAADMLLPTVISRCQRVVLPTASQEESKQWLLSQGVSEADIESLLYEYGNAPYLILSAVEEGRPSLRNQLSKLWAHPELSLELAPELAKYELDDLLARWMRITFRFATNVKNARVHEFWNELVAVRRANYDSSGLNKQLQLERLLIHWAQLRRS